MIHEKIFNWTSKMWWSKDAVDHKFTKNSKHCKHKPQTNEDNTEAPVNVSTQSHSKMWISQNYKSLDFVDACMQKRYLFYRRSGPGTWFEWEQKLEASINRAKTIHALRIPDFKDRDVECPWGLFFLILWTPSSPAWSLPTRGLGGCDTRC